MIKKEQKIEHSAKIARTHAIMFATWCLRLTKKIPNKKKYRFKHENKEDATEYTIAELYEDFIFDYQADLS